MGRIGTAHTPRLTQLNLDGFVNFFRYFKAEPQQVEALRILFNAMPASLLDDTTSWITKYRQEPPAKTTELPIDAVELIMEFEGCVLCPYKCPAGIPTVGFGATFYQDNSKVKMTDPCLTQKQAVDLLQYHLQYFWNFQETSIPFWNEMNDNQRGCLLSFSFNCGAAFYGNSGFNTISACLRERRWSDVPDALMLYVNPGSAAEVGLKRRRRAEGELWIK